MQHVVDYLAKDVFGAAAPERSHGRPVTVLDLLATNDVNIGARFRDQPLVEAAIRLAVGESYGALGQTNWALPHVTRAVAIRAKYLGPAHPETLAAESVLVDVFYREGTKNRAYYESAERIARHLLEARRRTLGR